MRETNTQFTKNKVFTEACGLAETPPTRRQASKYRRGLGLAIKQKQRAFSLVNQERINKLD